MCRSLVCFDEDVIIRLDLVRMFREIPDDEVTHHFLAQRERGAIHFQVVRFENRQNRYVLFTRVDQVYDLVFQSLPDFKWSVSVVKRKLPTTMG